MIQNSLREVGTITPTGFGSYRTGHVMHGSTLIAVESPLHGWRMRLREADESWEVRVVMTARLGITTLRRYGQPSRELARHDLQRRFLALSLADAAAEWNPVLVAFSHFLRGRPGIRVGRQPVRDQLNKAADRVATARIIAARGLAAILAQAGQLGIQLLQTDRPAWLPQLVKGIQCETPKDVMMQDQLDRISSTLLGKSPL